MKYQAKDFSKLLGKLNGLSDVQLKAHFELYEGYVEKLNEIEELLSNTDSEKSNYSYGEFSELKRREAVAFNGMVLHELYFENLSPQGGKPSTSLRKKIETDFGSIENLENNLKGSAMSTPGWALLCFNRIDHKLHTYILFEHHQGLPAQQDILLVLDCWEHAYMIDYGISKKEYLDVFFKIVNWEIVNERAKFF